MEKLSEACRRLGITPGRGRQLCSAGRWPTAAFYPEIGPHGEWWVGKDSKPENLNPRKLSNEEQESVAQRRIAGEPLKPLAEEYGISEGYVSKLAKKFSRNS